jgi:hypothetical protein
MQPSEAPLYKELTGLAKPLDEDNALLPPSDVTSLSPLGVAILITFVVCVDDIVEIGFSESLTVAEPDNLLLSPEAGEVPVTDEECCLLAARRVNSC